MLDQLKIALLQPNLVWENPKQNRKHILEKLEEQKESFHLLVLPETFTTGFSMQPQEVAETMDGKTVNWLKKLAAEKDIAITGSLIIEENSKFYNRLLFVYPNGNITYYNKRHTFTLAGEDKVFTAGNERVLIDFHGWKLCPQVCYDLRFPVWSRNTDNYDVLLYVANWPKPRIQAWDTLLKARAIENMCYCIGVNRVGEDPDQNEFSGNSAAYDVLGNAISNIKPGREQLEVVTLDKAHISYYRNKLKFLEDKDSFNLVV
ncbi:MAG TPA: nitrilase family protein [Flavobacteriaceae bacterium]|nr:nitrilase family protein [Flavobacteriaceae bacterium]